jgi:hypothetical protein
MSTTVRTPITDKNGKQTHVNKKVDTGATSGRTRTLGAPPKATATKASKPGLVEGKPNTTATWNPEAYLDPSYPAFSTIVEPKGQADAKKQLNDASGRKSKGAVRWVELNNVNTDTSRVRNNGLSEYSKPMAERNDTFNVVPPTDGTPMIVRVGSGMVHLNVESGNAVVVLNSNWGNSLRVSGDANVTVIAGAGMKVSIDADEDAKVRIVPGIGTRGHISPKGNAEVDIVDYEATPDQHTFTDFSAPVPAKPVRNIAAEEARVQDWIAQQQAKKN